jgi:large subunit ribosomal protein L21
VKDMYALIQMGGHQHKVTKDMVFLSELTGNAAGSEFSTDKVMAVGAGESLKIGMPFVAGAAVKLKVLADVKAPKINGYVYKKRKGYQRAWGHRQPLQKIQVVDITG